jgi:hypothetical protein
MIKFKYKSINIEIKKNIYNVIIYTLFIVGATILVPNSFNFQFWEYIFIKDYKFDYDPAQFDSLQLIIGFIFIIIPLFMLIYNKYFQRLINEEYSNNVLIIKHQGLGEITLPNFKKKISGKSFKNFNKSEVKIDDIKFDKNRDYQKAIQNQIDIFDKSSESIKNANQIAYFGISRIPLTFLLGNLIGNNTNISVFDFNREDGLWNQISYSYFKNFLKSKSGFNKKESNVLDHDSKDLVITISISYSVDLNSIEELIISPFKRIDLEIKNFKNGFVDRLKSHNEASQLKFEFKYLLDEVSTKYPNIEKIHLFYSGPNSLAFLFGAIYSDSIHKKIIVYNYNVNDTPKYSWGININKRETI